VIKVRLTIEEYALAVDVGLRRMLTSQIRGHRHASTYRRTWLERTREETIGACGELAFCKGFGLYWAGPLDTFHEVPDAAGCEVRSCDRDDASLIIRDNDDDDLWYYLVTGEPPDMAIRGRLLGSAAKRERFERNPHGHRPAWFVPQRYLLAPLHPATNLARQSV
jgi:hypothetical protein